MKEGVAHLNLDVKEPSYFRASAYSSFAPFMSKSTYAVSLPNFCHAIAVDTKAPTIEPAITHPKVTHTFTHLNLLDSLGNKARHAQEVGSCKLQRQAILSIHRYSCSQQCHDMELHSDRTSSCSVTTTHTCLITARILPSSTSMAAWMKDMSMWGAAGMGA